MITFDTSAIFANLNRRDANHRRIQAALANEPGPWLIPAAVLGEIAYLIEERLTPTILSAFLADLDSGELALDCGEGDFARVRALVQRYADLPLGVVDAAVIACAERNGGRVLTFDLRHFGVVAREGRITILPT